MDNTAFLSTLTKAFEAFLERGTSRSTQKLKPLHGAIAADLAKRLGNGYEVFSQGYEKGKEKSISGRYFDKKVDIVVTKNGETVGGIGVKFVMQNYSQNSNNYFENMLGETANIRCGRFPYFQIFIVFDKLPYYKKDKTITKWETFSGHNVKKYEALSHDNVDSFFHTPNKTLLYVIHLPDNSELQSLQEYLDYYKEHSNISLSPGFHATFGRNVLLNDYETFMSKVYHTIKAQ